MFIYSISVFCLHPVQGAGLRRLGKVLHLSKSGNLIVRLEINNPPQVGTEVFDPKLEKIGTVNNVMGPVAAPYLSVTPASQESSEKLAGRVVYLLEKR
jgi:rRNA processing protein Gar1